MSGESLVHVPEETQEYLNLQTEMVRMHNHVQENKERLIVIVEGRDSAGKGGAIKNFTRYLNPRFYHIVALRAPDEVERGQWYFQRYVKELPAPGEIVFFDRSWYNRAVVEPVMGFCTEKQYTVFMKQVIEFEKMLIQDGIKIIKFWFSIKRNEQNLRLIDRKENPLKQWKLSTVDMQAQMKWDEYSRYKELMFEKTSTKKSPWVVIDGNNKNMARLEAQRYILSKMNYPRKGETKERLKVSPDILKIVPPRKTRVR